MRIYIVVPKENVENLPYFKFFYILFSVLCVRIRQREVRTAGGGFGPPADLSIAQSHVLDQNARLR